MLHAHAHPRHNDIDERPNRIGIDTGELLAEDPTFVRGAITGLVLQAVSERGAAPARDPGSTSTRIADFVLRALLTRPETLPEVQASSATLVDHIAAAAAQLGGRGGS